MLRRRDRTRFGTRGPGAYRASRKNMTFIDYWVFSTGLDQTLKRLIEERPSGMPPLSGTDPPGTVCGQCHFYGYDGQPQQLLLLLHVAARTTLPRIRAEPGHVDASSPRNP